jgi:hypothetical protein
LSITPSSKEKKKISERQVKEMENANNGKNKFIKLEKESE